MAGESRDPGQDAIPTAHHLFEDSSLIVLSSDSLAYLEEIFISVSLKGARHSHTCHLVTEA